MVLIVKYILVILHIHQIHEYISNKQRQLLGLKKQFSIFGIAKNVKDQIINIIGVTKSKIANNIYKIHPCNIIENIFNFIKMLAPNRNQQSILINDRNIITQLVKQVSTTIFNKLLQIIFIPVFLTLRIIVALIELLHIDELLRFIYITTIDLVSQSLIFLVAIYEIIVDRIIRIILLPKKAITSIIHQVYLYIAVLVIYVLLLSLFPLQIYYHLTKKRDNEQEIELIQQHVDEVNQPEDNHEQQQQPIDGRYQNILDSDINNQDQNQEQQQPQKEQQVNENSDIQLIQEGQENTEDNQVNDNQNQEQNNEEQYKEKEDQQIQQNQQNDQQFKQEQQQEQFNQDQNNELIKRIVDLYNKDLDDEFKPFVGENNDYNRLLEHYNIKNEDEIGVKFVNDNLSGFIRVRGDGNCFYTSLIYQYLNYMLQNQQRFDIVKNQLNSITFFCIQEIDDNQNIDIIQQDEEQLKKILLNYFQQIYENPNKLKQLLQNYNNEFYGLSIIYFKSLLLSQYLKNEELKQFAAGADIENDLKVWLRMSNSAEILMKVIADQLKWSVQIYFLQSQENIYQVQSYRNDQNEHDGNFLLLFQPGHYQIPVLKN